MLGMNRYEPSRQRLAREAKRPNPLKLLGVLLLVFVWIIGSFVLGHLDDLLRGRKAPAR